MNRRLTPFAGLLVMVGQVVPAYADSCRAPLPSQAGMQVSGTIRYVDDGDGLCVGRSADPNEWIEVRLADFDAPELSQSGGRAARTALRRIALHREIRCIAERSRSGRVVSFDRVIARCMIQSASIGDLLRAAGAPEGGN